MSADSLFRIGQTNHHVRPGDTVWTDIVRLIDPASGASVTETVPGVVRANGNVLIWDSLIVPLENCRLARQVIRL